MVLPLPHPHRRRLPSSPLPFSLILRSNHLPPCFLSTTSRRHSTFAHDPANLLSYRSHLELTTSPRDQITHSPTLRFDRIYVSSLPGRKDRREQMELLARALRVKIEFVDASLNSELFIAWIAERVAEVRGAKAKLMLTLRHSQPRKTSTSLGPAAPQTGSPRRSRPTPPLSSLPTFWGHSRVIRKIVKRRHESALVHEDAYALSSHGASTLLPLLSSPWTAYQSAIDVLFPSLISQHLLHAFSIQPPLVIQRKDGPSDVQGGNGSPWRWSLRDSTVERLRRDGGEEVREEGWEEARGDPGGRFREDEGMACEKEKLRVESTRLLVVRKSFQNREKTAEEEKRERRRLSSPSSTAPALAQHLSTTTTMEADASAPLLAALSALSRTRSSLPSLLRSLPSPSLYLPRSTALHTSLHLLSSALLSAQSTLDQAEESARLDAVGIVVREREGGAWEGLGGVMKGKEERVRGGKVGSREGVEEVVGRYRGGKVLVELVGEGECEEVRVERKGVMRAVMLLRWTEEGREKEVQVERVACFGLKEEKAVYLQSQFSLFQGVTKAAMDVVERSAERRERGEEEGSNFEEVLAFLANPPLPF